LRQVRVDPCLSQGGANSERGLRNDKQRSVKWLRPISIPNSRAPEHIVRDCYALQASRAQDMKGQEKDRAKDHKEGDHQEGYIFGGSVPRFDRRMRDAEDVYEH
jgi:hypothetical protein